MEVLNFILIVMFLIVSAIEIAVWTETENEIIFKPIFFIGISILCIGSILNEATKLRDGDVLNGEAEYVETIHICNGDTIRTYSIQPKESK